MQRIDKLTPSLATGTLLPVVNSASHFPTVEHTHRASQIVTSVAGAVSVTYVYLCVCYALSLCLKVRSRFTLLVPTTVLVLLL